jgi:hypothetical protein
MGATAGLSRWGMGAIEGKVAARLGSETQAAVQTTDPQALWKAVYSEQVGNLGETGAREFADKVVQTKLAPKLATVATRATRARAVAGITVPAAAFGSFQPTLKFALDNALGGDVQPPRAKDVLGTTAAFMVLNALSEGRGVMRQEADVSGAGWRGEAPAPGGGTARIAEAGMDRGTNPEAPPPPAPPTPGTPRQQGLARSIVNGKDALLADVRPNPYDSGRTAMQGYQQRLGTYLARPAGSPDPTDEEVRSAAARVRSEVKGAKWLWDSMREPSPAPSPEQGQFATQMGQQLTQALAGKPVELDLGDAGKSKVVPLQVAFYPWDPQPVRVSVADAEGTVAAFRFASIEDLNARIRPLHPAAAPQAPLAAPAVAGAPGVAQPASPAAAVQIAPSEAPASPAGVPQLGREPAAVPQPTAVQGGTTGSPSTGTPAIPEVSARVEGRKVEESTVAPEVPAPVVPPSPTATVAPRPAGSRAAVPGRGAVSAGGERALTVAAEGRTRRPSPEPPVSPVPGRVFYPDQNYKREADARGFADRLNFKEPDRAAKVVKRKKLFSVEVSPVEGRPLPDPVKREKPATAAAAAPKEPAERPAAAPPVANKHRPGSAESQGFTIGGFINNPAPAAKPEPAEPVAPTAAKKESAGQVDMFGNAPLLGEKGEVAQGKPREDIARQEAKPGERVTAVKPREGRITDEAVDVRAIKTNPKFQMRGQMVREENLRTLLQKRGGMSLDELKANPPIVWRDTNSELGSYSMYVIDGHHRVELAKHDWGTDPYGAWVRLGGPVERQIPVKVFRGTLAEAQEYARTVNQKGVGNTQSELARIANDLAAEGKTPADIAAALSLKNEDEAQALVDFFHVDPAIRDEYFPDGAEDSRFGSRGYANTLGSYVRRWPEVFTKEVQRARLQKALKNAMSQAEFKQSVVDFRNAVKKIDPGKLEGMPDSGAKLERLMDPIDRVARQVRQANDLVGTLRTQLEGVLAVKQPVPGLLKSVEAQLRKVQKEQAALKDLRAYVQQEGQKLASAWLEKGADMLPGIRKIEERVRAVLGEENPTDYGAETMSCFGSGAIAQWLSRAIWRALYRVNVAARLSFGPRVDPHTLTPMENVRPTSSPRSAWLRAAGKDVAVDLFDDETGRKVGTLKPEEEADPASIMLTYRLGAMLKAGGNITLTRRAYRAQRYQRSDEHRWEKTTDEMFMLDVWGKDVLKWLGGPNSPHDILTFDAIEGRGKVPKFVEEALVRRQRMLHNILEECQEIAVAHGMTVPREITGVPGGFGYVSHVQGSYPVDDLSRLFIEFKPEFAGDKQKLDDARNTFFEARESDDPGRRSVLLADAAYVRAVARWRTLLPLVKVMRAEIGRVAQQPKGAWRAEAMRIFFQAHYFTKKGDMERGLDEGFRHIYYAEHSGQVKMLPSREVAEQWLALEPGALEKEVIPTDRGEQKLIRFYAAKHGIDPKWSSPRAAKLLGTTGPGMDVWGVYQGRPRRGPVSRRFIARWENGVAKIRARLRAGVSDRYDEFYVQEQLNNRDRALAFQKNPTKIFAGRFLHRAIRAVTAYSMTSFVRNILGGEFAMFTEYGPRHFLVGHVKYGGLKGYQATRAGLHATLKMFEKLHLLSPQQRAEYDQLMPLLAYEMMGTAIAAQPGEIASMRQSMQRLERGWSETDDRMAKLIAPMGHFMVAESLLRGLDIMAAVSAARSQGLRPIHAKRIYDFSENGRREAWKDLVEDIGTEKSVMDFVSERQGITQYYYDPLGRPAVMSHFAGKLLMALQTYKINYLPHQDARPVEGFIRWLTGITKRMLFGQKREPSVDAFIRHSAAVFMWQAALYGLLIAASDATGYNFMAASVPIWVGLLLLLDKTLRPHNAPSQRRWKMAQWGLVNQFAGPAADIVAAYGFIFGGKQGALDIARMQTPIPLVLAKRLIEENPERFDRPGVRVIYRVLGQKSALWGLTNAQRLKHHAGLMSPVESAKHRHPIGWSAPYHPPKRDPMMPTMPNFSSPSMPSAPTGI